MRKFRPIIRLGLILCIFFANFVFISPAKAATLYSTISSSCAGYGMSANSLRTVIPFTAPSSASLTGFDLKFGSSASASSMTVKVYSSNPTLPSPTLIGNFTYSWISGTTLSYSGNLSLPSAGTYWLYFQTSVYNQPCYAMSPVTTGSSSGWTSGGRAYESFNSGGSWTQRGTIPTKIFAPPELNSHHFRDDPKHQGRGDGPGVPTYFREIIHAIKDASEILIIGHGHGKASSMLHFIQYLERKEPNLAAKIVDAIDTNLIAMTEPEILAMARDWFDSHSRV